VKKFLRGVVGLVALGMAVPAMAADLPVAYSRAPTMFAALYDWSGLYVGANGGWGSSHKCWDIVNDFGTLIPPQPEGCHNATGGVAGGQLGYRLQSSAFVYGIEFQGNWADLRGSNVSLFTPGTVNQSRIDAFAMFTGQVGYAIDTVLLYVKGGGAVVADRYNGFIPAAGPAAVDATSAVRWGAVVGAGLEYAFAPNWSAAVEYDHMFMGTRAEDLYSNIFAGFFSREDRIRQDVDLVTVRVNYRWGGPVIAKY
jgi:outer membrane immunogenic protein